MTRNTPYSQKEDETIKELYPWQDLLIIAMKLDRTATAVTGRAHVLGLRRKPTYIARRMQAEHSQLLYASAATPSPDS